MNVLQPQVNAHADIQYRRLLQSIAWCWLPACGWLQNTASIVQTKNVNRDLEPDKDGDNRLRISRPCPAVESDRTLSFH
jgi:hypothetical protein